MPKALIVNALIHIAISVIGVASYYIGIFTGMPQILKIIFYICACFCTISFVYHVLFKGNIKALLKAILFFIVIFLSIRGFISEGFATWWEAALTAIMVENADTTIMGLRMLIKMFKIENDN